ncbi:MAG TPA: hypothetical protein VJK54_05860 [Chthoniobacterales bacterium]|nr:hypothetical protein [Chthoniobacterales bacterium]
MKKHILNLLVALLSTNCLFAATNQVIGCRLQMPLPRQEMEDRRWKMEVEAQGCSFQNIEGRVMNENEYKDVDNQSSLLANDSVPIFEPVFKFAEGDEGQGVDGAQKLSVQELLDASSTGETKPFAASVECEDRFSSLPSSSSYLGVTPKLMMNPETKKELEDVVKLSRNSLVSSEASSERGVLNAVQTPLIEGEESISAVVPSQGNVIKSSTFNFEEKVAAIREQIKEATQASKEVNGGRKSYLWSRIVTKLKQSRDSWNKFGELFRQGEEERAFLWKKMAEESEASAEKVKQFMKGCVSKDERQLEEEVWNFYYLSDISTLKLKSKDAEIKAGKLQGQEKEFWQGLAQQYQEAADYEQRVLEVDRLEDEKKSCIWIGRYLYSSAKRKLQSIEAKEVGKDVLAIGYQDAAGILEKAIEEEKKALTAYALGKENEAFDYSWLAGAIQHQANYQVEMIEAQERGKIIRVEGYRAVLEILQRAINLLRLSVLALEEGREKESTDLHRAGELFQEQANYQAKIIEAEESGKTELAKSYQEAIITLQGKEEYKLAIEKETSKK